MAPSSDKDIKYINWSLEELSVECDKRNLEVNENSNKDQLIKLLIEDDIKPPDWGKIYARVLYHTGMGYEEIARRTIPQIRAILDGAEENISIKIGMPNMFNSIHSSTTTTEEESTQEDVEAFFT